jgi:hypothetical protein
MENSENEARYRVSPLFSEKNLSMLKESKMKTTENSIQPNQSISNSITSEHINPIQKFWQKYITFFFIILVTTISIIIYFEYIYPLNERKYCGESAERLANGFNSSWEKDEEYKSEYDRCIKTKGL